MHGLCFSRVLRFIQVFLQSLVDGEKDSSNPNLIRVNITKAYEIALKRYHGWFVQQLFKVSSGWGVCYVRIRCMKLSLNTTFPLFRQLFMPLPTSQISWRRSPKVGRWRRKNAWKKSGNFSSTSLLLWMLFMTCLVEWTLILTTRCDDGSLRFCSYIMASFHCHRRNPFSICYCF